MRNERIRIELVVMTSLMILAAPLSATAQMQCVIDFNGDGAVTVVDFNQFAALWTAGNSRADLNADGAVDNFDIATAVAYSGFNPCPAFVDFQYNRVIDTVDALFFQFLFALGSQRADVDGDGFTTPVDFLLFNGVFASSY